MAVSEDGAYAGSLSGGCIEAAVVAEAQDCIKKNTIREVRFGAGSPYLDIRLPCGGSLDLLITPLVDGAFANETRQSLKDRRPTSVRLPRKSGAPLLFDGGQEARIHVSETFVELTYAPALRLAIFGHGANVEALHSIANTYGADTVVFTPDDTIAERLEKKQVSVKRLTSPEAVVGTSLDRWTAEVFLFHDHDWEPALLMGALSRDSFFIGAMGSRKTHANRIDILQSLGANKNTIERIIAPIGLIPSTRDPETLAISTLAQIVNAYQTRFLKDTQ